MAHLAWSQDRGEPGPPTALSPAPRSARTGRADAGRLFPGPLLRDGSALPASSHTLPCRAAATPEPGRLAGAHAPSAGVGSARDGGAGGGDWCGVRWRRLELGAAQRHPPPAACRLGSCRSRPRGLRQNPSAGGGAPCPIDLPASEHVQACVVSRESRLVSPQWSTGCFQARAERQ